MPTSPDTTEKRTRLTSRDEKRDNAAEVERLIRERTAELREENDALRRENAELRQIETIYASSPVGLCLLGTDTRYLHVNQRLAEMNGFSVEEHIGKRVRELVPDLADAAEELARAVVATGEPALDIEIRGETPAQPGVQRYWNESWRPVTDNQGRIIAISIVAEEITERKRAEEALRESEEKYRNLVELAPEPIAVHRQGDVVYVNPPCVTLFGAEKREDLVGKPVLQFVHPDDHEAFWERYREMTEKGTTVPLRAEKFVKLDGQAVDVEAVATPIMYENLPSVMVLFRDITERKRAEEERARLHRDLEVSNREANLYLDILTHDIGNTENVSNLYADLLIESLDGEAAGYAKKLQRSIQKSIEILGIVSTIRRIHRTKTGLKPTDLDATIREVMKDYPTNIFLYNGTNHQVQADDLLPVVFDNLIGNAVKFGGPDVKIAIRIEEDDGFVRVSVEDTGPGIPNVDKGGIFHCYEMKKRGVGTGLGLYLVKILVERYGGTIWVEDQVPGRPEEGAAFRFTLKP